MSDIPTNTEAPVEAPVAEAPVAPEAAPAPTAEVQAPTPPSFVETLPEDLRSNQSLQQFKDVESLAKSYVHAQGLLGKKVNELGSEEIEKVYAQKLGAPESRDDYELPPIEWGTQEDIDWYRETAHGLNLTQNQANKLMDAYKSKVTQQYSAHQAQVSQVQQAAEQQLKQDWGGQYDDKLRGAKAAAKSFGGDEFVAYLNESGLGNDVRMIKTFSKIYDDMTESSAPIVDSNNPGFAMTPEQAKTAIGNLKRSREFMEAYMSPTHPGHESAVDEMQKLHQLRYETG